MVARKPLSRSVLWAAVALAATLGSGDGHSAVSLGVAPPIIELSVPPGRQQVMDLRVYNQGDSRLDVRAYISAIEVGSDGAPFPLETKQGKWSCADWITLDSRDFRLAPGDRDTVRATIRVPRGASGGRYAVIMFEGTPVLSAGRPWEVALGTRVGTIVMETIPRSLVRRGEIEAIEVFRPEGDSMIFAVSFRNTGNVHLKARGSVVIQNVDGRIVDRVPLDVGTGTVLPDGLREFKGTWANPRKMVKGSYTGEARVSSSGMATASDVVAFSID